MTLRRLLYLANRRVFYLRFALAGIALVSCSLTITSHGKELSVNPLAGMEPDDAPAAPQPAKLRIAGTLNLFEISNLFDTSLSIMAWLFRYEAQVQVPALPTQ